MIGEFGVDARYRSQAERERESKALMEARLERMKAFTTNEIAIGRLIQLQLQMERFAEKPVYEGNRVFNKFLSTYIDILYGKRKYFANAIKVTPILLSQVLNNHREPNEAFVQKLMVHSQETFKEICSFDEKLWYVILSHDRISEMMERQAEWKPIISKQVHAAILS